MASQNSIMKKLAFVILLCILVNNVFAQNNTPPLPIPKDNVDPKKSEIFKVVEQMPEYPGGEQALYKFISDNIRYPDSAANNSVTGKVKIKFVIDEFGAIQDVQAQTSYGFGLEDEAIRVIRSMPHWKPGINNGKPVKVYFQIPINFTLSDGDEKTKNTEK